MNVLSLFDGMSCGRITLSELGIPVEKYYASEVDKFAIKATMQNFPDTIQLGDVRELEVSRLDKIDLIIGGSPCTNLSMSGKRKGLSTKEGMEVLDLQTYLELKENGFEFEGQSYLFWEYMRIYHELIERGDNPKFFLENVEMGKKWESVFNETMGRKGIHINSALVSAQNRRRIYWTDIHDDIPQPEDRGILLRDILEEEVDEKYFLQWKDIDLLIGGTPCQDFSQLGKEKLNFDGERSGLFFEYVNILNHIRQFNPNIKFLLENVKMKSDWADLISSHLGVDYVYINSSDFSAQMRARYYWCNWEIPAWKDKGILFKDIITDGYVEKDKSWCMLESWNRFAKNPESLLRRYKKSLTPLIFNSPDCNPEKGFRTPNITEAERLQTVPEGYTKSVQPHIGMGLLGNGWTVDVISHILKGIK